jgi:hypothetical protein
MYCSKCGKEIGYDALVCRECEQSEARTALVEVLAPEQTSTESEENPRMRGFGKALAGCIIGFVATIISVVVYMVGLIGIMTAWEAGSDIGQMTLLTLLAELLAIIPAIVAIVYGVRSIKVFKTTPTYLPKPIATLVVGIHAIFFGGFALLYSGIFLFILMIAVIA